MSDFLRRKTMNSWKSNFNPRKLSEGELLKLAIEEIQFAEVMLEIIEQQPLTFDHQIDALVEIAWHGRTERYICEMKGANTPKAIESAMAQATFAARSLNLRPMILVPYLSEEKLQVLAGQEVSGLDACGNAFIQSDQFLFWRSGRPNRFRMPSPHLNPFRGDNSIFSRCFLSRHEFESLSELREFATDRMERPQNQMEQETLRLGTASKTVQALEEELIVQKTRGHLKLLDRRKLLSQLKINYHPAAGYKVKGKIPFDKNFAWERLQMATKRDGLRFSATGTYSATYYGVLSPSETLSIYVDDISTAMSALEFSEVKAFANCELIETKKNFPYFDLKRDHRATWASMIQTWLELANGTPREQEAGHELEKTILQGGEQSL